MKFLLRAFGLMAAMWAVSLYAAELTASVDRNPVTTQETLTLILQLQGHSQDADVGPDLSPLQQDFEVLGQSQSSRVDIVNGHASAMRQWQITLFPKHAGTLTIPPLRVGDFTSRALELRVLPAARAQADGEEPEIFLEAEVEPAEVYVQGQAIYTLRLFTRVSLRAESFPDPKVEGLHKLGEDQISETLRNDRRYTVAEKRYAVFPERSGELEIPPVLFSGTVNQPQARRSSPFGNSPFGDLFNTPRGKSVRIPSPSVTLKVKPAPAEFTGGDWLPAASLVLTEAWQPDPPEFRVGEPVTRSFLLQASGTSASRLPEIPLPAVDGINAYPDQPQLETRSTSGGMIGSRAEKVLLRPTRAGTFTLPEVRIPWWDTTQDTLRYAVLPASTVTVRGTASSTLPQTQADSAARAPFPQQAAPVEQSQSVTPVPAVGAPAAGFWPWLSAILGAAWLVTLLTWWRSRHVPAAQTHKEYAAPAGLREARNAAHAACRAGDAHAAQRALLEWGRLRWPHTAPNNLGRLGARLDDPAAQAALRELDGALYAAAPVSWDGSACWQRLEPALRRRQHERPEARPALPRLYPQTLQSWSR